MNPASRARELDDDETAILCAVVEREPDADIPDGERSWWLRHQERAEIRAALAAAGLLQVAVARQSVETAAPDGGHATDDDTHRGLADHRAATPQQCRPRGACPGQDAAHALERAPATPVYG
jgi:hypothetical protein